jgi:hypothetical protein
VVELRAVIAVASASIRVFQIAGIVAIHAVQRDPVVKKEPKDAQGRVVQLGRWVHLEKLGQQGLWVKLVHLEELDKWVHLEKLGQQGLWVKLAHLEELDKLAQLAQLRIFNLFQLRILLYQVMRLQLQNPTII